MTDKINGRTHEEIKRGLEICKGQAECVQCPYFHSHATDENCVEILFDDALALTKQLESELEPLRKAKEDDRLIILPYAPGTLVYVVDDYEVVPMQYHPSMYGRRCNTSKEELYKEFYKEIGVEDLVYGTERKNN